MNHDLVGKNPRVLVVDDNPAIHQDFRKILCAAAGSTDKLTALAAELFGGPGAGASSAQPVFEMESAHQGQEALAIVERAQREGHPFAMAFVDVRMPPGWDGVETVARIWKVQPDLQVVICTAYSDYSWSELFDRLGRSDRLLILKKPFDNIEVQQLAAALTEKWRLTQEAHLKIDDLERRVQARTSELEATMEQLAQARKMEAVGQLAGGVAHDYNNILTATLMQLGMLAVHPELTPRMRDTVEELEKMAKRAAALTRQLLTFSRRQVVQAQTIDLNDVIANLLNMLQRLLSENIELDFRPAGQGVWIEGDVGMMEQVVTNLCVNARDAMPGGGRLRITTTAVTLDAGAAAANTEARAGDFVRIAVEDTGCGMDAATMRHLFEPFFTTKELGKGTGLGLATVYGITKQHNGWVQVRSGVGEGTEFQVYLPAVAPPASAPIPVAPVETTRGSACVLLVEDEEIVRATARMALERFGYRVLEAGDGPAAVEVWAAHAAEIDVLFSDMVMPHGMTGLDLAARFKAERPQLKVVVTSGYSLDLAQTGAPAGANIGYLAKPYLIDQLANAIRKALHDGTRASS